MDDPVPHHESSISSSSWEQEVRNHQELRSQMVRGFGFTVMDQGVALTRCPDCKQLSSVNSAFPDSDWNSLFHLMSVLETFVESGQCHMTCSNCSREIIIGKKDIDFEYWLWHAHYLAEVKLDLQLLIHRKNAHTSWIEGMLISDSHDITPINLPSSEIEFQARTGCYFSLRQAWKEFLMQEWPVSHFAGLKVSDGYFLVVNPAVESDADLHAFKENCIKLVGESSSSGGQYEFADLSWADSWNFEENTYHQWLNDYEADLEESTVIAGVLASAQQFFKIAADSLPPFGCWLRQEGDNDPVAVLGDNEYYLNFDYREYLINAMIKGYNYWGALRYIEPILDSWERARDIGERLKEILRSYKCTVYGGRFFQCRAKRGKKVIQEFDLLSLQEPTEDFENQTEFLNWIAPQISLNPSTLVFEA